MFSKVEEARLSAKSPVQQSGKNGQSLPLTISSRGKPGSYHDEGFAHPLKIMYYVKSICPVRSVPISQWMLELVPPSLDSSFWYQSASWRLSLIKAGMDVIYCSLGQWYNIFGHRMIGNCIICS